MGKAVVTSGGEGGLYAAELVLDSAYLDALRSHIADQIIYFNAKLSEYPEGSALHTRIRMQIAALEKRDEYLLENRQRTIAVSLWCADLVEDIAPGTVVATAEINGDYPFATVQMRPAFDDVAAHDAERDGGLSMVSSSIPAAALYNLGMLPGWQKWKPTYRHGIITAIAGDLADVDLDPATSSQQSLDINQTPTLHGVPVDYMRSDGNAFEVGDAVLVEFAGQDWASPKVIGFRENPAPDRLWIRVNINGNAAGNALTVRVNYDPATGLPPASAATNELGVAGPFAWPAGTHYAELHDEKLGLEGYIFSYFEEVQPDDAEYILKFWLNTCGGTAGGQGLKYGAMTDDPTATGEVNAGPWYLKQVRWNRASGAIGTHETGSYDRGDGREVACQEVNFVCHVLKQTRTYLQNFLDRESFCEEGGPHSGTAQVETYPVLMSAQRGIVNPFEVGRAFPEVFPPCQLIHPITWQACSFEGSILYYYDFYGGSIPSYSIQKPAIITDAVGGNPTFPEGQQYGTRYLVTWFLIQCNDDPADCIDNEVLAYEELAPYDESIDAFQMVETPISHYA